MTVFALDTNIISYILRSDDAVINRFRQESARENEFVMLPVVYYEVSRWLLERNATKLGGIRRIMFTISALGNQ